MIFKSDVRLSKNLKPVEKSARLPPNTAPFTMGSSLSSKKSRVIPEASRNKIKKVYKLIFFRNVEINSLGVDFIQLFDHLCRILFCEFIFDHIKRSNDPLESTIFHNGYGME